MYEALGHPRKDSKRATDNPKLYGPYAERHGDFGTIIEQCDTHRICKDCCNMIRTPKAGGYPIPPLQMCDARVRYLNQLGKSRGRGNYQQPPYPWSICSVRSSLKFATLFSHGLWPPPAPSDEPPRLGAAGAAHITPAAVSGRRRTSRRSRSA